MAEKEHKEGKDLLSEALVSLQDRLYAFICTLMGNSDDALDVLQETSRAVFSAAAKYDASRPPWPWFKQFAVNQVRVWQTHRQRSFITFDSELVDRIADSYPDERAEEAGHLEYVDFLDTCLQKLKPWHRDLLNERYAKRVTVKTLSDRLHITYDSLAVLLFQLRKALKKCIEKSMAAANGESGGDKASSSPFNALLEKILDQSATPADRQAFCAALEADDENVRAYVEQMRMNALLQCHREKLFNPDGVFPVPPRAVKPVFRVRARAAFIAAAALAVLLAGGKALFSARQKTDLVLPPSVAASGLHAALPAPSGDNPPAEFSVPQNQQALLAPVLESPAGEPLLAARRLATSSSATMVAAETKKKEKNEMKATAIALAAAVATAAAVAETVPSAMPRSQLFTGTNSCDSAGISLETRSQTTADSARRNLITTKFKGLVVMLI